MEGIIVIVITENKEDSLFRLVPERDEANRSFWFRGYFFAFCIFFFLLSQALTWVEAC